MKMSFQIYGSDFSNAGLASSQVKKQLVKLNLDPVFIRRTVVALYEAEVNIVAHARKGTIDVDVSAERIEMLVRDEGPGIPDIKLAMEKGYSTASQVVREMGFGAGMGLPNIRNNTDYMEISSEVSIGTKLIMINRIHE